MKKIFAVLLAAIMVLSLAACNSGGDVGGDSGSDAIKVGIVLANADEFTQKLEGFYKSYAPDYNIEPIITNAGGDSSTQLADMESVIAQNPDVIIIRSVDAQTGDALCEMAEAASIPVLIDESAPDTATSYAVVFTGKQTTHGEMIGTAIMNYLDEHPGETLYLGYINGGTSDFVRGRMTGIFTTAAPALDDGRLVFNEEVGDKLGSWSATTAAEITEAWLTSNPEINVIACANDEMALGVIETLETAGVLDRFLVFGVDGTEAGQAAIRAGKLTGTTFQDSRIAVNVIYEYAVKIYNGETFNAVTVDPKIISYMDIDTIDDLLGQ